MALLRVPTLLGTHSDSTSLASSRGGSLNLFLHRPTQVCDRGPQLVLASVTEVQRNSRQERTHSPKPSSDGREKHIPPWRTSWTPIPRKSKHHSRPTRDWSNQQQRLQRGSQKKQGKRGHGDTHDEGTERAESSSDMHAPPRTAMARIIEKLRDLQKTLEPTETDDTSEGKPPLFEQNADIKGNLPRSTFPLRTAGELFLPRPKENIFSIGNYWSTPDHPIPAPGRGVLDTKFAWEFKKESKEEEEEMKKRVKTPSLAELIIPPKQLKRLRTIGIALERPIKVGRLGITDNIADKIIGQWRNSEVVKVKCGGPAATNMMKIHKDLERKTGGLVVWRSGSVVVVFRGNDYDMDNKVATSLEVKLNGLLKSEQTTRSFSESEKHVQASEGLPEDVSGGTHGKAVNIGAQDIAIQNGSERDAVLVRKLATDTDVVKDIVPTTNELEHIPEQNDVFQVSEPLPMDAVDSEGDDSQTDSETSCTPQRSRPIMYPDPFVDRDYEIEIDSILETLGPRCKDWQGPTPVPVDADLLPPLIPNYRPPYRLLPFGVRPQLTNIEQTDLRRLIRHIAPHFVLGRNRGHQGLAAAILKLWEKSEVVKIAVKAGVQNTSSEKMAEELKRCTGGVLLSRDRYFITLYRGKDFLPHQIAIALTERTIMLRNLKAGDESSEGGINTISHTEPSADELRLKAEQERIKQAEAAKAKRVSLAKELEEKLVLAVEKKRKAERELEALEAIFMPVDEPADLEPLTEEEKYMFRKLGLKMGQFLLVGRRGVYDGVVENMHLHWKHRELVKLIVKERDSVRLQKTARMLEYESGGVLIAIESTNKGQAIIIYRGKNYQRPENLRPQNLLNKKKALQRSLEMQRRESLASHISGLEEEITKLKSSLSDSERVKDELLDAALDEFSNMSSEAKEEGVLEDDEADIDMTGGLTTELSEKERFIESLCTNKKDLLDLVNLGPIYRATRISNLERLKLRKVALKLGVGSRFHVGKSNGLVGLARAIRVHFLRHSLVVIGIKNRGQGTSVQDLVHDLEDLTGAVLVSIEIHEIIMYRGWPKGEKMPFSGSVRELSPELLAALETEEEDDDMVGEQSFRKEVSDASDDDEKHLSSLLSDVAGTNKEEGYDFAESSDRHVWSTGAAGKIGV